MGLIKNLSWRPITEKSERYNVVIFLLFAVFLFLRLYGLGKHDLWYDEIFTVNYARHPWGNWNAPLYWMLMHFWVKFAAISEFSLRLPSAIFSFVSVILLFCLGKELFNRKTGIIAALFIGLSPFHLWYAQEARDYSMALFFAVLSSLVFIKGIKTGERVFWLLFILVSLAGLYTDYFFTILLLSQLLYLIITKKIKPVIYVLLATAGFIFYIPYFLIKFVYVSRGFWLPNPGFKSLFITLSNFINGYTAPFYIYFISGLFILTLFIIAINLSFGKTGKDMSRSLIFCLYMWFAPLAAVFIFSKLFFSIYLDRALIIFSPCFYLFLAAVISFAAKSISRVSITALGLLLSVSLGAHFADGIITPFEYHSGTYIKRPVRPIVNFLKDKFKTGDLIAFTNKSIMLSFNFYNRGRRVLYYFFDPELPDTDCNRPEQEDGYHIGFSRIRGMSFKRLWIIALDWPRSGGLDENSKSVKAWLDENLNLEYAAAIEGAQIYRYARRTADN